MRASICPELEVEIEGRGEGIRLLISDCGALAGERQRRGCPETPPLRAALIGRTPPIVRGPRSKARFSDTQTQDARADAIVGAWPRRKKKENVNGKGGGRTAWVILRLPFGAITISVFACAPRREDQGEKTAGHAVAHGPT